jgi:large subunit ribosomal protein L33
MVDRTPPPGSGTPSGASLPEGSASREAPVKSYGASGRGSASGSRTRVALACTDCASRNYQTTRKAERQGQLTFKKFCPGCNKHTVHKETK